MKSIKLRRTLYILSFIEGGAVMATELLGVKMLAPYFGSSLYVWASVLAVTLGGLTGGYFWGGLLSQKENARDLLFKITLLASALLALMPITANLVMGTTGGMDLIPAILITSVILLLPPLICMGMVSPILIRLLSDVVEQSGKMAGRIYAISTVGGIIVTLLLGFYLIPAFGLTRLALAFGLILGTIPLIMLFKGYKAHSIGFVLVTLVSLFFNFRPPMDSDIEILYKSEGLLGQLMVCDFPPDRDNGEVEEVRILFNDRILQSVYNPGAAGNKHLAYVLGVVNAASIYPKGARSLILGLGGGSVAVEFKRLGFEIDACELDERVVHVAQTYFNMDDRVNVIVDDGRHYVRNCKVKYDVITVDMFGGEVSPGHILTMENLAELEAILNPGGLIIINNPGFLKGKIGRGVLSVYKTLVTYGFKVKVLPTPGAAKDRNVLLLASLEEKDFSVNRMDDVDNVNLYIHRRFLPAEQLDTEDAMVLTDDFPVLNVLNRDANRSWRMGVQEQVNEYRQNGIPLFN